MTECYGVRHVTYARLPDGSPATYPLIEIRGAEEGPAVAFTAGIHGDEYEGVAALWSLAERLGTELIRGHVMIVPVANGPAFSAGRRESPADGLNLARIFPGDPFGTLSHRLADSLMRTVVDQAELLVDSHSGGALLAFLPVAGFYDTGEGVDADAGAGSLALARQMGLPHVWRLPKTPGVLSFEAARRGVVVTGAEVGGRGGALRGDVETYLRAYLSVLANRDMIDGKHAAPLSPALLDGDWQRALIGGYLDLAVGLGEAVRAGDRLACVRSTIGEVIATIEAETDGVVMAVRHLNSVGVGDLAVCVTHVEDLGNDA